MSDILNYKFYLNFKNEDSFGRLEISEPVGFDGASFAVEQDEGRYGRDVYKINEEIDLNFYKGSFESSDNMQQLPNGTVIYNLTQGYDWLVETFNRFKFEANVDFEIELNGITFIPSNLDFATCETDDYSYFSCKAVQEQGRQLIKRRADIVTDIFSTEDLDGNAIEPVEAVSMLLRAKPIVQESNWLSSNRVISGTSFTIVNLADPSNPADPADYVITKFRNAVNNAQSLIKSDIDNSLSFLSKTTGQPTFDDSDTLSGEGFTFIEALNDLTDITVTFSDIQATAFQKANDWVIGFTDDSVTSGSGNIKLVVLVGDDPYNYDDIYTVWEQDFEYDQATDGRNYQEDIAVPSDFTLNIDLIPRGKRCYIFFSTNADAVFDLTTGFSPTTLVDYAVRVDLTNIDIGIRGTSTAIDTVIQGVRYIDVIKANALRVNNYEVDAARYDVGGEYYDQFMFTGNMIKGRGDIQFPVKFKDLMSDLKELNSDYQVIDKIYIGQYQDFYTNKEIGAFLTSPDASFKKTSNERYSINEFSVKYKEFEQDREESNTIDAIHTDSQWLPSNKQVENTKEVEVGYVRDPFKIEATRKLGFKKTTSTSEDDKPYLIDIVSLSPTERGGFTASMTHFIDESEDSGVKLQLLIDEELPSWELLGFDIGSEFIIESSANNGTYEVFAMENTIITLTPVAVTAGFLSFSGEVKSTKVNYPYNNVQYVNRTNEGLVFAENLLNSENYSNLRYSIKRNMFTWFPYLSTASIDEAGTFRNTYFKDNGICTTRFDGEPENIVENANILNVDFGEGILTPFKYETRLLVGFSDMVALMDSLNTINEDKTIAGFIRCIDNNDKVIKLYPQKLEYIPSTETLTVTR